MIIGSKKFVALAEGLLLEAAARRAENREYYSWARANLDGNAYIRASCTLRFGLPRQMGNSTVAAHLAGLLKNALVVVLYTKQISAIKDKGVTAGIVAMTSIRLRGGVSRGLPIGSVIVDCASLLEPGDIELLEAMVDPDDGWLILIG